MTYWTRKLNQGTVSDGNSTSTALLAGGVFTGVAVDTIDTAIIYITTKSDVASAVDGLSIQFSSDGTNWDSTDEYSVPANAGKTYSMQPALRHMRVVYTNGSSGQAFFRLQTILKTTYGKPSSHRLKDTISSDDDVELVKAVTAVQTNDSTTYKNVDVQNPMPNDGDSVYGKDLIIGLSSANNFDFKDTPGGTITEVLTSMVSDVHISKQNTTGDNPKTVELFFQRPVQTTSFGINSYDSGNFSNVKIYLARGENETLEIDESLDSTKRNFRIFPINPTKFSSMRIEFHTADPVNIGLIGIFKNAEVAARIQALNDKGQVVDATATNDGNLKVAIDEYGDTPSIDAFARLRISEPFTIFDSKQLHDKQPLFWSETSGGSATSVHNPANAATRMTVTANAADYVIRQTKQRFNYQPGKSQLIFLTYYSPQVSGLTKRIGVFDGTGVNNLTPNNGIFFEIDGTLSWNICKAGSTAESVDQANWNIDKLDGTGVSGITYDSDAPQIAIIDYEWLGVGRVRVGFVIDGLIRYVHYFNHANNNTFDSVYMSTPNLPIRYSIETDGTNGSTLDHICGTIISEGGIEKTGVLRSIDTGDVYITPFNTGSSYALLGIRLKSTHLDVSIIPEAVNVIAGTNDSFKWTLQLNPTIAGTFTYGALADSAIEYAVGATTNTISANGLVVGSGGGSTQTRQSSEELKTALRIGSAIAGTQDELVLVLTPLSTNMSGWATLNFRELL